MTPDGPVRLVGRRLRNNKDGKGRSSEGGKCFCIVETLGRGTGAEAGPGSGGGIEGGPVTTATIFGF